MNILYPHSGGRGKIIDYSVYTHKICSKCKIVKPVNIFRKEKKISGVGWRYVAHCNDCVRIWHQKHTMKKRREAGILARRKRSPEEAVIAQRKNSRRHYWANAERERARTKKWKLENPEKQRFMEKRRKARKKGAPGSHTIKQWEQVKLEYNYMCPYCQRIEPDIKLTQDHIIPLFRGGGDNIENIQPLCASCNASKGAKLEMRYETHLLRFRACS